MSIHLSTVRHIVVCIKNSVSESDSEWVCLLYGLVDKLTLKHSIWVNNKTQLVGDNRKRTDYIFISNSGSCVPIQFHSVLLITKTNTLMRSKVPHNPISHEHTHCLQCAELFNQWKCVNTQNDRTVKHKMASEEEQDYQATTKPQWTVSSTWFRYTVVSRFCGCLFLFSS